MSIIYSYPEQGALNANDMLIGTSAEKVGGKQKNITRNFTVQQIADFINRGAGFVDPVASDFQIPVFNQGGKKITGSIISQNTSPSNGSVGSAITITGSLTVANGATIGDFINDITLQSPTALIGPIKDANSALSAGNQILLSTPSGNVVWQNYEAGLTYEGTWNASTNTPTLTSSQGVSGHFYIVSVAGNTNLDGNNDWHVGDWAVFFDAGGGGTAAWQKIDNTSVLTGNGTANTFAMWTATETLNDSLLSQDVGATKVIVDGLLEVKGDGASQDGRIKLNCSQNSHGVTIQSPPHSAGASYTLVLPTSVGTSGQALTTDGSDPAQLSWTTLTAPVTGTGTENYVTKWSAGGTGIENSTIFDNGTNVGIGTNSPLAKTQISTTLSSGSTQNALLLSQNTSTSASGQGVKMFLSSSNSVTRAAAIEAIAGSSNDHSLGFYTNSAFSNPTEKMRISSAGNVGIGTTSPSEKLSVSGNSNITGKLAIGSTSSHASYDFYNQNTSYFNGAVTLDSTFTQTGGGNSSFSGNVGIGTTSPSYKLDIAASVANQKLFRLSHPTSPQDAGFNIGFNTDGTTNNNVVSLGVEHSSTEYDVFNIQRSTRNVGIGTTSPAVSLDISATDAVQMPVGVTGDRPTTGVSNGMLRYNSTNNEFEGYINGNWGSIGGGASGGLIFRGTFDASTGAIASGGSLYTCPAGGSGGTVDTAIGDLYIVTTAGSFFCSGTSLNVGDEVICITAATATNDNVNNWNAIASGAGGAVTGSGTTNYVPKFTGATVVGNSSIYEDTSGNVGIGTVSPSAKLEVDSGTTNVTSIFKSSDNQAWISIQDDASGTYGALIGTDTDAGNDFAIADQSSQKTFVINSGNVGIGTTSPGAKLDVSSSSTSVIRLSNSDTALTEGQKTGSIEFSQSDSSGNGTGVTGRISMSSAKNGSNPNYYGNAADMIFQVGALNGWADDNATLDALIIKNGSGRVGIGTDQPEVSLDLGSNTDAIQLPAGDNTARAAISNPFNGMIRYNTTDDQFEGYSGIGAAGSWGALGGGLPTKTVNTFTGSGQSFIDLTVEASSVNYIDMYIDGVYQAKATYTIATPGGTAISRITLVSGTFPTGVSIETVTTT